MKNDNVKFKIFKEQKFLLLIIMFFVVVCFCVIIFKRSNNEFTTRLFAKEQIVNLANQLIAMILGLLDTIFGYIGLIIWSLGCFFGKIKL